MQLFPTSPAGRQCHVLGMPLSGPYDDSLALSGLGAGNCLWQTCLPWLPVPVGKLHWLQEFFYYQHEELSLHRIQKGEQCQWCANSWLQSVLGTSPTNVHPYPSIPVPGSLHSFPNCTQGRNPHCAHGQLSVSSSSLHLVFCLGYHSDLHYL